MRRVTKYVVGFLATASLLCGLLLIRGSAPQVPSGSWAPAGNMAAARAGAASVLLQNGRTLITGGVSGSGALASVDLFDTTGSFCAAPPCVPPAPMNFARSKHTATVLQDGRGRVAGGIGGGGTPVASAEIYDPAANTWTVTGSLLTARSGHTASLLQNGAVLIAGGDSSGVAQSSLEIYDPTSGAFAFTVGALSSPRESHAAAVLQDGRVLLVGGNNGKQQTAPTVALATSDLYDPATESVAVGPALSTPRQGLSATTQLDGKVFVAGGNNGTADLASAEVFDPATGTFTLATSKLATARQGHQAFLLPHNNNVLLVGGTSGGVALNSSQQYMPWAGSFNPVSFMASARASATGGAISQDGLLLVAGGKNASGTTLASGELYGFATVKTDHADYTPGSVVTITGSGWQPGETVSLSFLESPYYDSHPSVIAVADANGNIFNNQFSPDINDSAILFYLTATGSVSQAQTTFHDTNTTTTSVTCSPNPIHFGSPATCTGTVTSSTGSIDNGTVQWSSPSGTFSPTSCTLTRTGVANQTGCSVTFTPTSLGSLTITANFFASNNGHLTSIGSQTTTLIVTAGFTATSQSIVYGTNTVTLSGTLSYPPILGTPTGSVMATINGVSGPGTVGAGGAVSLTFTGPGTFPVSGSPYTIAYTYSGDSIYVGSTDSSTTLTVTPAPLTITANNKSRTYGTANPTLDATYSGFVNGQGPSALTGTLSCTTTPATTSSSPAGKYPINCSGQTSTNYAITYVAGTLTINP